MAHHGINENDTLLPYLLSFHFSSLFSYTRTTLFYQILVLIFTPALSPVIKLQKRENLSINLKLSVWQIFRKFWVYDWHCAKRQFSRRVILRLFSFIRFFKFNFHVTFTPLPYSQNLFCIPFKSFCSFCENNLKLCSLTQLLNPQKLTH